MTKGSPPVKNPTAPDAEDLLVTGNLWKAIWSMSWPLVLTTTSSSLIGLVDIQISSRLGSAAQAAVGVSEQILFMFMVLIMAIGVGTTALVSRAAGAKETELVDESTGQSLMLSITMGVVLTVACLFISGVLIGRTGNAPDVSEAAKRYLGIYAFVLIPFSVNAIVNSAFRAIGKATYPLFVIVTITIITIAGDFLTVVGNWPVPGLGLKGIALSGVIGSSIGTLVSLGLLLRSPLRNSFSRMWPPSKSYAGRILKVGLPTALHRLSWSCSVFVLFAILRHCQNATQALASWTIGMRLEAMIFMPLMALGLAVAAIVGQNLGAKQIDRAVKAGWQVTWIGIAMMVVLGASLFFGADFLANRMSQDPITIAYTKSYLRINACSEPMLAIAMVLGGALQGAGDTRTPMWFSLITNWLLRLPLAWLLSITLQQGPSGTWLSMAISISANALLTAYWYHSRRWVKTEV